MAQSSRPLPFYPGPPNPEQPMNSITHADLTDALRLHTMWVGGKAGGIRLELAGHTLIGIDLSGWDLSKADLSGADLQGADLRGANLRGVDLSGANLTGADLRGADLQGACLEGTDLFGAKLVSADLRGANLIGANINSACLPGTILDPKKAKPPCPECKGNPYYLYANGFTAPTPCSLCWPA